MEMERKDFPDELRREEGRLENRRDPRDVGLSVSLESAGVSDSYDVRVRVIGGELSARAEKERPNTVTSMCGCHIYDCQIERSPPGASSCINISTCGQKHFDAIGSPPA